MRRSLLLVVVVFLSACGLEGKSASRLAQEATPPPATPTATPEPTPVPTEIPTPTVEPSPTPAATASPTPAAVEWSRIDEGPFSFELPEDAKEKKVQGIDSQVGRFESESLLVEYDYGWYSGDPAEPDAPEYRDQWTRIDGEFAHLSYWKRKGEADDDEPTKRYLYQAGVYFSDLGEDNGQTTKFNVRVYSHEGHGDAERIFKSIRFEA